MFEIKIARLILPVDELSFSSADIFVVIGLSTGSFVIPKFPKKRILINITVSYIAYYNVTSLPRNNHNQQGILPKLQGIASHFSRSTKSSEHESPLLP